jgi:hypothetical protein
MWLTQTISAHTVKGKKMADMKEKLVELLSHSPSLDALYGYPSYVESAKWLIDHGVTVQGDKDMNVPTNWISVKDRLPEEEGWYLVYTTPNSEYKSINKAMFCKGYALGNFEPYWHGAGGHWANVTHWMPLPEPPKGE